MKREIFEKKGMLMDSATTLASLAMLKVNIDSGRDYLEYLRPYVIHVLHVNKLDVVTDVSVATGLRQLCGLEIPHRTVNLLLQRLAKDKHLVRGNGVYTVANLPDENFDADRADSVRHLDLVAAALAEFAKNTAEREISTAEATDSIVAFLSQFSIQCMKSFLRGTALPKFGQEEDWQIVLVGQFVHQIECKPQLFESFMRFVEGHMLANALLCPDLEQVSNTYESVVFYFDTPVLIKLLGLEGDEEKQAVEELIQLVSRLKGKIYYFSHTSDELITVIRNSSDYVDSPKGRGSIVAAALKSGRTKSDLILVAENTTTLLEKLGVSCVESPRYDQKNHRFEIAEEAFATVLDDEVTYFNPRARDYDIKSVRAIYVLRKGMTPPSIEKSKAVFVTSNVSFSKAAFEYGKIHEQSREVSTVITDFSLANTAWLKAPQGASLLPQKEVLALAYAAMQPTQKFWTKVLEEADKLQANGEISARDHQLLRSSRHVQDELMKLTLGSEESLTKESITRTVQRVTDEIRKEDAEKIRSVEGERSDLMEQLTTQRSQMMQVRQNIFWHAKQRAQFEAKIGSFVIWSVQGLIALAGVISLYYKFTGKWWGFILCATGIGSSVLRFVGTRWDLKPIKAKPVYVEWRCKNLVEKQHKLLSLSDESIEATATV
ncbi:hypothetical protein [Paraburkholderia sediminicola]|uniref:hypothetical protein n=2 Tax=Paraburkholderia sediminicola TaxID=458836 RepID=UPI0038BA3D6B